MTAGWCVCSLLVWGLWTEYNQTLLSHESSPQHTHTHTHVFGHLSGPVSSDAWPSSPTVRWQHFRRLSLSALRLCPPPPTHTHPRAGVFPQCTCCHVHTCLCSDVCECVPPPVGQSVYVQACGGPQHYFYSSTQKTQEFRTWRWLTEFLIKCPKMPKIFSSDAWNLVFFMSQICCQPPKNNVSECLNSDRTEEAKESRCFQFVFVLKQQVLFSDSFSSSSSVFVDGTSSTSVYRSVWKAVSCQTL